MIKILDKPNHFLGKSFTLSGAIEALADPLLVIAVLAVCMIGLTMHLSGITWCWELLRLRSAFRVT